jgi:hypothetical protein
MRLMELLLFDLGAALAALLGYGALAVLGRWGKQGPNEAVVQARPAASASRPLIGC